MKKLNKIGKILIVFLLVFLLTGCTKQLVVEKTNDKGKKTKEVVKYDNGKNATGQSLTKNILCRPEDKDLIKLYKDNEAENYRFGICVSKKLGNAVTRNLIKRRVKDIIDKSNLHFANKDYIIVLKKSAVSAQYLELKEDLISVLKKFDR